MTGSAWQWARAFGTPSRIRPRLLARWTDATIEPEPEAEFGSVEVAKESEPRIERHSLTEREFHEQSTNFERSTESEIVQQTDRLERSEVRIDRRTRLVRTESEVARLERLIRETRRESVEREIRIEALTNHSERLERQIDRIENPIERTFERQFRESQIERRTDRFETKIREIVRQEIERKETPDIRVEIGRIDVISPAASKSETPKTDRPKPILDLADYLKMREDRR